MIEIITTEQKLRELATAWEALENVAHVSPFSTYAWVSTWWRHFGAGRPLRILAAYDDGRLTGIAPFYIGGNPLVKRLEFVGSGRLADYGDFIVHPDADRAEVLGGFMRTFTQMGGWHTMTIKDLPGWSPNLPVLNEVLGHGDELLFTTGTSSDCPYIELTPNWDSYFKGLSRSLTGDISRQERRIANSADLAITWCGQADKNLVDTVIALHADGRDSVFADDDIRNFLVEITPAFGGRGQLYLALLETKEAPIAFLYNVVIGSTMYFWLTGFDHQYGNLAPGKVLLAESVRRSFKLGLIRFDFMRGAEPYKFRWTDKAETNVTAYLAQKRIGPRIRRYADQRIRSVVGSIR